ncbi:hypothetical protein Tco_1095313 [Tanacetum coccineum]
MSASSSQDEIPPPPPPPPSSQTPTQQTPHTVSTIKLPILKKGEYDIWAMKMEHYLAHTDYPIWEVIQNGNGPVSITTDTSGQIKVLPPRTAEEIVARERERKARTTLLMALPEDHLAKFHKMTDAKEMWDAIKSRFGGNDESKKMQKYILKQQFEGFSVSNTEGLHKGGLDPKYLGDVDKASMLHEEMVPRASNEFSNNSKRKSHDTKEFECQSQVNDKYKTGKGYHAVPPLYNGNFMPPKPDLVLDDKDEYVFSESVTSVPTINKNETESKSRQRKPSNAKVKFVNSNEHVKSPRESVKKIKNNKQAKYPRKNSKSPRDCDYYEKKMVEKFVWNNARRMNHQNSQRMTHPHLKRNFVPKAVLMKSSLKTLNSARQNSSRATISVNTARPINTANRRATVNCARPTSNVLNRAHSHVRRHFNKFTTNKNSNFNEKVNTVRGNITTVGTKAVVSDNKRNKANAVKASTCWVWRPKQKVLDYVFRHNGASMNFKRFDYVNLQLELQEKGVIDSGCSRHMTGNKSYLSDYEEIDGGFVAFGGNPKGGKITRKGKFEGFFVGYSVNSKAFRVFNSRTRIVEENLHITFLENKPNVARSRPTWLFDIDTLTRSMNYKPVVIGNKSNGSAGTKACDNVGKARVETEPSKDYILLPLWTQNSPFFYSSKDSPDAGFKPSGEEEKKDAKNPENEDSEVPNTEEPRVNCESQTEQIFAAC